MIQRIALLALCLAFAGQAAHAECKDNIPILQHALSASIDQKAPNVQAAKAELAKAQDPMADEVACDNALHRAWHAFQTEPPAKKPNPQ
jgi:hypothetical protein